MALLLFCVTGKTWRLATQYSHRNHTPRSQQPVSSDRWHRMPKTGVREKSSLVNVELSICLHQHVQLSDWRNYALFSNSQR